MSVANTNPQKVQALRVIRSLINCLVNIQDETGEFLMTLPDGRVIDTKVIRLIKVAIYGGLIRS